MTKKEWLDGKNVSESFKRRNPELYNGGGLQVGKQKPVGQPALEPKGRIRKGSAAGMDCSGIVAQKRLRVILVSHRSHDLDDDNLSGGMKPLRDAIANHFGIDDGDTRRIVFEYGQVLTRGQQKTVVTIEVERLKE